MPYSKPLVTIDLEEYQEYQKLKNNLEEDRYKKALEDFANEIHKIPVGPGSMTISHLSLATKFNECLKRNNVFAFTDGRKVQLK